MDFLEIVNEAAFALQENDQDKIERLLEAANDLPPKENVAAVNLLCAIWNTIS